MTEAARFDGSWKLSTRNFNSTDYWILETRVLNVQTCGKHAVLVEDIQFIAVRFEVIFSMYIE